MICGSVVVQVVSRSLISAAARSSTPEELYRDGREQGGSSRMLSWRENVRGPEARLGKDQPRFGRSESASDFDCHFHSLFIPSIFTERHDMIVMMVLRSSRHFRLFPWYCDLMMLLQMDQQVGTEIYRALATEAKVCRPVLIVQRFPYARILFNHHLKVDYKLITIAHKVALYQLSLFIASRSIFKRSIRRCWNGCLARASTLRRISLT